jgi:CRP-like cAMP-binding protein
MSSHEVTEYFRKGSHSIVVLGRKRNFAEGQKRDSMYVVKSGEVELNVRGKNVEVVGTDGFFGEMALVDQAPRSATASRTNYPRRKRNST